MTDQALLIAAVHDAEAVLLPLGGSTVLPFYDLPRGAPSPLELRFSIDDRPGVLRAVDISAALGLQTV